MSNCLRAFIIVLAGGMAVSASETSKPAWQTDVERAWLATQQQGKPLLVFVTRNDCFYCTKMKDLTLSSPGVAGAIHASFVPLVLDGSANQAISPLLKELNVTAYPSTFVISPQAVVLERIEGFVPPEALAKRLMELYPSSGVARVAKGP